MSNSVPSGAVGVSVAMIVYSIVCLGLGVLLFTMLWMHDRRYSYVLIISLLVTISTTASLIQQIHYAIYWRQIKEGTFEIRRQDKQEAGAAISNGSHGVDLVLFWIQFYTYNANAVLILFWSVALFKGTWRINLDRTFIGGFFHGIETFSKIFAVLFPAFLIGIAQIEPIRTSNVAFAILCNASLVISTTAGSILLILTLWKFMQSRRSLNGSSFETANGIYAVASTSGAHPNIVKQNQRAIDRSIIMRFSIAFSLLSAYDIVNIVLQIMSLKIASHPTAATSPDFSTGTAIADILTFIPGVTCSLAVWAIWGTTRKYMSATRSLLSCCRSRPRRKSLVHDTASERHPARLRYLEDSFARLGSLNGEAGARGKSEEGIVVETEVRLERGERGELQLTDLGGIGVVSTGKRSGSASGSGSVSPDEWTLDPRRHT